MWLNESGPNVTIASDHSKRVGIWFSSIMVYFVGTEQADGCSVSSPSDPAKNFFSSEKTKICSVRESGWVCWKGLQCCFSSWASYPVIKIGYFSSWTINTKYLHALPAWLETQKKNLSLVLNVIDLLGPLLTMAWISPTNFGVLFLSKWSEWGIQAAVLW